VLQTYSIGETGQSGCLLPISEPQEVERSTPTFLLKSSRCNFLDSSYFCKQDVWPQEIESRKLRIMGLGSRICTHMCKSENLSMESDVTMTLPSTCICLHHYWGLSHLNTPSRETLKEKPNKNHSKGDLQCTWPLRILCNHLQHINKRHISKWIEGKN
jgi:hypothetical protein